MSFCLIPHSLINADFCCAGSLIAYGALLGKVSPVQLLVVTLFGVTLFAVEEYIILSLLHVSPINTCTISFLPMSANEVSLMISDAPDPPQCRDAGGSMVIHAFGGYYGLAISWVLYRPNLHQSKRLNGSVYHSDVFAMIGRWPKTSELLLLFMRNSSVLEADWQSLSPQARCSCGCSGPALTQPSLTTATDSTGQPSTPTWLSLPLFSPRWPSPACLRRKESWTW